MGDGSTIIFRYDQAACKALEEVSERPLAAWLSGYEEDSVPVREPDGSPALDENGKARFVVRSGRMMELAFAMSASWRNSKDPSMSFEDFCSIAPPAGTDEWQQIARGCQELLDQAYERKEGAPAGPPPSPASDSIASPGAGDSSRDLSSSD